MNGTQHLVTCLVSSAPQWLIALRVRLCCWQMNYNNKQLIGAMIVAGWDEAEGGQVSNQPSSTLPKPYQQLNRPTAHGTCRQMSVSMPPWQRQVPCSVSRTVQHLTLCVAAHVTSASLPLPSAWRLPAGVGVPHRRHPGAGAVDDRRLGVHLHLGLPGLKVQVAPR